MATEKKTAVTDSTAVVTAAPANEAVIEPVVRVLIPLIQDSDSDIAIDQSETVIINGNVTRIKRGEHVDVKVPVFLQLKQRYPNI